MGSADNRTEIRLSDLAPDEAIHFSFSTDEFDLSGKKVYKTSDEQVIAEADTHEWLSVTRPAVDEDALLGAFREQLAPQDDHLSSLGSPIDPNDPAEVEKAEAAKLEALGVNVSPVEPPAAVADVTAQVTSDTPSKSTAKDKD